MLFFILPSLWSQEANYLLGLKGTRNPLAMVPVTNQTAQ